MHKNYYFIYLLSLCIYSCKTSQVNNTKIITDNAFAKSLNWFENSIYILHEDHHIKKETQVGKNADLKETAKIIALSKPDVIQMHAKGKPGYASYPTKIGWMAPYYERDVLKVWRDIARKDGYHFSIYYNLGRDGEIQVKKPQWNRVDFDGKPQNAALCYHSGVGPEYSWPMIAEIMDNYKPDALWFDGSVFTIKNCYCDVCKTRFKKETGLEAPAKFGAPGWTAYKEMQRQIYREFLYETVDRIKKKDPDCLVTINLAYSMHMPEKPYQKLDYFTADFGNEFHELSQEAHWFDNQGKPFEIMTTVHIDGGKRGKQPKPKPQIEQEMATILANGGRYNGWDNPDSKSAISEEIGKYLRDVVSPFLRSRQPWVLQSQRLPDVSILYSATNHYAATDSLNNAFLAATEFIPVTDKLFQAGLNYEMVPEYKLADGNIKSNLLIVENVTALTDDNIKALRRFTESGGSILVTGKSILHGNISELLGISKPFDQGRQSTFKIQGKEYTIKNKLYQIKTTTAKVLLKANAEDADYPLVTSNKVGKGKAMAVLMPLLSTEEKNNFNVPPALIKEIFESALPSKQRLLTSEAPANVESILRKKDNKHIVHLVNHAEGDRELIKTTWYKYYYISSIPAVPATCVSVKLSARPNSVMLQPQNQKLENWKYENGRLEVNVPPFAIHQMVVIE